MQKSTLYILGAILAIIVLVAGFYYFGKTKPVGNLALKAENDYAILLYPESGEVLYKTPIDKNFQKATSTPTAIPNETVVHTGNGKATVLFEDNSNISLDKNTEITIFYTKEKVNIFQSIGSTYSRVEKLLTGESYTVETPGTLAAVRGTKFAVKYDGVRKSTKVSVTENKVEVRGTLNRKGEINASTTEAISSPSAKIVLLEVGQTATVEQTKDEKLDTKQIVRILKTENDPSMKEWLDTNIKRDVKLDSIKVDFKDPVELREVLLREIIDMNKIDVKEGDIEVKNIIKDTRNIPIKELNENIIKTDTVVVASSTPKLTDEEFATAFDDLFIKYFFLDDNDTPCSTRITPAEKVRGVTALAKENGRLITKTTTLSFAEAIELYCAKKDPAVKTKLQSRFDDEYPF